MRCVSGGGELPSQQHGYRPGNKSTTATGNSCSPLAGFAVYLWHCDAGGNCQLALPADVCRAVYAQAGYSGSAASLGRVSLAFDGIFSDGVSLQLASVTGSVAA